MSQERNLEKQVVKVLETIKEIPFNEYKTNDLTNEEKTKLIFNELLKEIPTLRPEEWEEIAEGLGKSKTSGKANEIKIYKVGAIKLLKGFALKSNLHIAKDANKIYLYDGKFWIEVEKELMKIFLGMAAVKMGIPGWLAEEIGFVDNLYEQLEHAGFFEKMVNKNKTLINLGNGTLHISEEGIELKEFNAKDFLTHQLDFNYDLKSINLLWQEFLDTVLPDKKTQQTLQESLGYLFIKDLKLEKAIFLYGTGSNGKSLIFEVLQGLLSSEMMTNYSLDSLTGSGYHRANINNKFINYGSDISMKKIEHGVFKQLVSGEPIEVRQIRQEPFIMKNYAKLIFNLNKIDDANVETTIGFFRRMVFIPFEITISKEEQDKKLHKKILENKAGVLNWILEGVSNVLKNQEILISKKCDDFLESFKKESNLAHRFIEECSLNKSEVNILTFQFVYEKFRLFCFKQGEKTIAQRVFNNELKKLEFDFTRRSSGNVWFASYGK